MSNHKIQNVIIKTNKNTNMILKDQTLGVGTTVGVSTEAGEVGEGDSIARGDGDAAWKFVINNRSENKCNKFNHLTIHISYKDILTI